MHTPYFLRYIILSTVDIIFSAISRKQHDFRGENINEHKTHVYFSLQNSSEIFVTLRRNRRGYVINVHSFTC